jgi:hypothetical protein
MIPFLLLGIFAAKTEHFESQLKLDSARTGERTPFGQGANPKASLICFVTRYYLLFNNLEALF